MMKVKEMEQEHLLLKLEQKLGLNRPDEDTFNLMVNCMTSAREEMQLYLNCCKIPHSLSGKLVELAAIDFQQAQARSIQNGMKSATYSEGDVSQSVTYMTTQDTQTAKDSVLRSIAHYRRRATWR